MVAVELKGIARRFGEVTAVEDVSLCVNRGEFFFLLGPSGCGKTTLLRLIAGFEQPDKGAIFFEGADVTGVKPQKRNTGMVFQNYALWPHMSVAANVAYGLKERKVPGHERAARVATALEKVKMGDYADRMPNQLSGGQQQRVALARALVIEPGVVLLDEPLSNLDANLRAEMRNELRRIHEETGVTMIYVTHDQNEALSMADRIAVMNMGSVAQTGTARDIYARPASSFVARFVGGANVFPGTVTKQDGEHVCVRTGMGELRGYACGKSLDSGSVRCVIRPERLRVTDSPANRLECTVSRVLYRGECEELVLECNGVALTALRADPGPESLPVGERIVIGFGEDDMLVLTE